MKNLFFLLSAFVLSNALFAGNNQPSDFDKYKIDHTNLLIIVNIAKIDNINSNKTTVNLDGIDFKFIDSVKSFELGKGYKIKNLQSNLEYRLYFSQLPIVTIKTDQIAPVFNTSDYLLSYFTIIDSHPENEITSNAGIKIRGATSSYFAKKNYRLEFWEEGGRDVTKDVSLLGMSRNDDDWILQGFHNESLRLRSKVSFDLWQLMYAAPYKDREPIAVMGINIKYVDLFINDKYQGIYGIGGRVDRKQLKLKKYNGNLRGELYKAVTHGDASGFFAIHSYGKGNEWHGWEYDYPDEIEPYWNNLYDFVKFVVQSDNSTFQSQYPNRLDVENYVNYFIFQNLLWILDNTDKNYFLAKYDTGENYFQIPWDLDLAWGYSWDENDWKYHRKRDFKRNILIGNGLYTRLVEDQSTGGFMDKVYARWAKLRKTTLSIDGLISLFATNYNYLETNGAYQREEIVWNNYFTANSTPKEWDYLVDWIDRRIECLDDHFQYVPESDPEPEPDPKEDSDNNDKKITIYPNPNSDYIIIKGDYSGALQVNIYETNGKWIKTITISNSQDRIPLSDLPEGIYLIKLLNEKFTIVRKLIHVH